MSEKLNTRDTLGASVTRGADTSDQLHAVGTFTVECFDKEGNLKWRDVSHNLIVNTGLNAMLDTFLGAGTSPTSLYMSLITAGSATLTSTYASPTVTEVTSSIIANRVAITWTASSAGTKTANTTSFSILGSATITGNYVIWGGTAPATVGDTAGGGFMYSASNFTAGSKVVGSGDSLSVSYSVTL